MPGSLERLSSERAALMASLASVDSRLRAAACDAVRSGTPVARVARTAGVTRPTLYAWLRASAPSDEERLAELDNRYERLVDVLAEVLKPAPQLSRRGNVRSGLQAEHSDDARARFEPAKNPTQRLRDQAEGLLLRLDGDAVDVDLVRQCAEQAGFDAQGGDVISVILAELDEAYALRKRCESTGDAFFADV